MRKIIYYVAVSIDGYISGPNDDISGFPAEGTGITRYLNDLKNFDTVIMGRNTYEFGYRYGMKPGDAAYPHMDHYIFSDTLEFKNSNKLVRVCKPELSIIDQLKDSTGTDIYLCGGGKFAGWLLENERIDILKIKLNPLLIGSGTRLFGDSGRKYNLELVSSEGFDRGLQIIEYRIVY